jgi:pimeloyl-ACP methyl ester carboxylesterase
MAMNKTRSVRVFGRSRGRQFATALAAVTLAVAGVTACSDAAHEEDRPVPADQAKAGAINWGPCPEAAKGVARDPNLTCATVKVPLNYDKPDGTSIEVAISRLAAVDPEKRHGVLLLNPGGPALSGRKAWPLTAGMPANIWPCAFWQSPIEKPVTVTDKGPGDILILQNRRDHATSWDSGYGLRKVLGDRAAFVGVDNGGHNVYNEGSACADEAAVDFLNTGQLPDQDIFCTVPLPDVAQAWTAETDNRIVLVP